jgi:hypothetical protein
MVKGIAVKRPYTDHYSGVLGCFFFLFWTVILMYAFFVGDWEEIAPRDGIIKDFFILINDSALFNAVC